jgi:small subunit ribosomal protein S20
MARSAIQTSLKKITQAEEKEAVLSEMPTFFSLVDKAVLKGRAGFTKNKAANYKAKVHRHLAKIAA